MSLFESLSPTLAEINTRHQSLMVFISKAQKQLPVLHQKLETAQPKDVAKIREAVELISRHIDKNVQEAADLEDVAGALLIECEDDETGTASTAISQLKEMISRGQGVQNGLSDLQTLISGIITLLDSKLAAEVSPIHNEGSEQNKASSRQAPAEEHVEESVTVQNPPPPPPVPKTPVENAQVAAGHSAHEVEQKGPAAHTSISTPAQLEATIESLKTELSETRAELEEEIDFNRKQTELITEIQEDVNNAEQKHAEEVSRLQDENSRLRQENARPSAPCKECQTLRSQLEQARNELEELRVSYEQLSDDNQRLAEQGEVEVKELQEQLLELQTMAQREAMRQRREVQPRCTAHDENYCEATGKVQNRLIQEPPQEYLTASQQGAERQYPRESTASAQRTSEPQVMQVARSPNRVRHYDSVQTQLETQFRALQQKQQHSNAHDDELSDPDDAMVVCERSYAGNVHRKRSDEIDEIDVRAMLKEKEEMKQMIESLKSVLVKMSKNVSPEPEKAYKQGW